MRGKPLDEMYPVLAGEWSVRNGELAPSDVSYGSNKVVWWRGNCGHEWQATVKARTSKEEGCPYCAGKRVLKGFNDLATLHPELIGEWSGRNGDLRIGDITAGSQKKVWWKGKCGHEWQATVKNRANGSTCPYCSSKIVKPGVNDLATLRPDIAEEWSDRNSPMKASDVMANTNKKYWWKCREGHEWKALVSSRNRGTKCPYCSGLKLLPGFNDLATTHPNLTREWSERNSLTPADVNSKSRESIIWACSECGHEWSTAIYKRAQGAGCPRCEREKAKLESLEKEYLNAAIETFEVNYPWILLKHLLMEKCVPFVEGDIGQIGAKLQVYLPTQNIAIEIKDGRVLDGFSYRRELVKNRLCAKKGIRMVRILEPPDEYMDGCICIKREDLSSESLDEAYMALFEIIGIKVVIDSRKISEKLFKGYVMGEISL